MTLVGEICHHDARPRPRFTALQSSPRSQTALRAGQCVCGGAEEHEQLSILLGLVGEATDLDQRLPDSCIHDAARTHQARTALAFRKHEAKVTKRTIHDLAIVGVTPSTRQLSRRPLRLRQYLRRDFFRTARLAASRHSSQ